MYVAELLLKGSTRKNPKTCKVLIESNFSLELLKQNLNSFVRDLVYVKIAKKMNDTNLRYHNIKIKDIRFL